MAEDKILVIDHEIEHVDTDSFGVVHFSRYSSLMEKVSLKLLSSIGYSIQQLSERDRGLVIREQKINYLKSAKYGDVLRLEASIAKEGGARIIIGSNVYSNEDLIAKGKLDFVCINKMTGSPMLFVDR